MAGDWLKFETNTPEKPEVLSITIDMGWDDPDLTVGKLLRVWRWFDQHTEEGNASNVTAALLDRIIGVTGFCFAMAKVGWLEITDAGVSLPNFDRHNGKTAKNRSLTAKRVATHKGNAKANATGNAPIVTEALAREEKRREEVNNNPLTPLPGGESPKPEILKRERKTAIQLKTFIENCRLSGEKPISGYQPLLTYVDSTGLPMEFIQLAWEVFKGEFLYGDKSARMQKDWRSHFLNYVRKGYFRLWYGKPGDVEGTTLYSLTTQGLQAKADVMHREAA